MLRDQDLVSIQEARDLVALAAEAQKKFSAFSQSQVDAVVEACAAAAAGAAESLALRAVEETGFGNVRDKTAKNRFSAVNVAQGIRGLRTVGATQTTVDSAAIGISGTVRRFVLPEFLAAPKNSVAMSSVRSSSVSISGPSCHQVALSMSEKSRMTNQSRLAMPSRCILAFADPTAGFSPTRK